MPVHRHRSSARLRLASLALLAPIASACVLLVPTARTGGPHCGFAGADTSCGTCVAAKCIAAVDACCADEACGGIINDLESCSMAGKSCERLGNASDGDGVHRELSACVTKQCHEVCASASPANLTQCKRAYVTSVDACSCQVSGSPNSDTCTSVAHPNLRCCAPTGWPGPALKCDCLTVICVPIGGGCQCQLTDKDDQGRDTECKAGKHCCASASTATCSCGDQACLPQDTEVPACNIAQLGCSNGEHMVESCSAPKL